MTLSPRPFTVNISQSALDDLQLRLAHARLPEREIVDGWDQGVPCAYVEELLAYWRTEYDWRRCEAALNAYPQYLVEIDGLDIHYLHIPSANPDARPLILTHGWPGSVIEFIHVIPLLTDSFHLIIPSLPGYGFSGKPSKPGWDIPHIATAWDTLMRGLGYDRYFAQGGDWGAAVTDAIGQQNLGACAGIHLNMVIAFPSPDKMGDADAREMAALARLQWYRDKDTGYSIEQKTRPQTLGYALADSPVGQMAWIIEKFHGWSDCGHAENGGHPESVFSRDHLLDNVMIYWLNNAGASSARLYWHSFGQIVEQKQVTIPMGGTCAPYEIFRPSRRWAEARYDDIVFWNEPANGGHFLAMERPEIFAADVKAAFGEMTL